MFRGRESFLRAVWIMVRNRFGIRVDDRKSTPDPFFVPGPSVYDSEGDDAKTGASMRIGGSPLGKRPAAAQSSANIEHEHE